jgi:hypothetical protein
MVRVLDEGARMGKASAVRWILAKDLTGPRHPPSYHYLREAWVHTRELGLESVKWGLLHN